MKNLWLSGLLLATALIACNDDISDIGASVDNSKIEITADSIFSFDGDDNYSTLLEAVPNRTVTQLLGNVEIPQYGKLSSDFITQFMPAISIDTTGVTEESLDSLVLSLNFSYDSFIGDSLAPMQLSVYRLNKTIGKPVYSNIDPSEYYSPDDLLIRRSYNASVLGLPSSQQKLGYKTVSVKLPIELGKELFNSYRENPNNFSTPRLFSENVFAGMYVQSSYGNGNLLNIQQAIVSMYYKKNEIIDEIDSTYNAAQVYMAITPEVICNNLIRTEVSEDILSRVEQGELYIQSPAGLDAVIHFPAQDIINRFREATESKEGKYSQGILNGVNFSVPIFANPKNNFGINPPQYLLFVRKSEKDKFFQSKQLTDDTNTFYAQLNESTRTYDFGNIRNYILEIMKREENYQGNATAEDEEIVLTPIWVYTETTSNKQVIISDIVPYITQPTQARIDKENIKIKLVYSSQSFSF